MQGLQEVELAQAKSGQPIAFFHAENGDAVPRYKNRVLDLQGLKTSFELHPVTHLTRTTDVSEVGEYAFLVNRPQGGVGREPFRRCLKQLKYAGFIGVECGAGSVTPAFFKDAIAATLA